MRSNKRSRKELLGGMIAVIAGIAIYYEVRSWKRKQQPMESPRYLVANYLLEKNHPIGLRDFSAAFQDKTAPTAGSYTDQDWHLVEGRKLRRALAKGDRLRETDLEPRWGSLGLPFQMGESPYALSIEGTSYFQPGDRVDILAQTERGASKRKRKIVRGVKVYEISKEEENHSVLLLSPQQIQIVEKEQQIGKLTLVRHQPLERSAAATSRGRARAKHLKQNHRVEVFSEES